MSAGLATHFTDEAAVFEEVTDMVRSKVQDATGDIFELM